VLWGGATREVPDERNGQIRRSSNAGSELPRTGIEFDDPEALTRQYHYYDPIYTLPEEGQEWWRAKMHEGLDDLLAELATEQGIEVGA
jgi:hypothetical protein